MSSRIKFLVSSLVIGALSVGLAYAGSGLVPVDLTKAAAPSSGDSRRAAIAGKFQQVGEGDEGSEEGTTLPPLQPGQVYAGAAKASTEPRPDEWGGQWEQDYDSCATLSPSQAGVEGTANHVADFRVKWAENPDCLYMGGYGIGPMNPITNWEDPHGLWVRSVAIGDGRDTVVLTILDGVYYFADYNTMCDDCGWVQLADELGGQLGIAKQNFMFATTHSHTSPDFIGGWGGVPQWYMDQVADAVRATVKAAVAKMRPAVLEVGEEYARGYSSERRDFYRSAEDDSLTWFRLLEPGVPGADQPIGYDTDGNPTIPQGDDDADPNGNGNANGCENGEASGNPLCLQAIATVGATANHPVTEDTESGTADADFPAVFDERVEDLFGGVGLYFQTGFGNISPRDGGYREGATQEERDSHLEKENMGWGMASLLPDLGDGRILDDTDVRAGQFFWDQPVTNSGLTALGLPGFFDRPFSQTPAQVQAGKSAVKNCKSASPVSVNTLVSAARIGDLWITGGPGELFSNLTNTIKEKHPSGVSMPLSLVNDGLGYIMQSFETDHAGRQITGFVGEVVEYEDAYSIDACFGDMVLESTLNLLGQI